MPFVKGKSGNPGGRVGVAPELRAAARTYSMEALETLVKWMRSDDARASVLAANSILDRAYGKPVQAVTGDGADGEIRVVVRQLFAPPGGEPYEHPQPEGAEELWRRGRDAN